MSIICADSLVWMKENPEYGSVITSIPDAEEIKAQISKEEYPDWFRNAAYLCFKSTAKGCVTVFLQTDRMSGGKWLSKTNLICSTADLFGVNLIWHKIELRRDPGKIDLYRPTYRNILAFGFEAKSGKRTSDVLNTADKPLYKNGISFSAAEVAVALATYNSEKPILDPFCGRGTIPYVAKKSGHEYLGIDIDEDQCEAARRILFL